MKGRPNDAPVLRLLAPAMAIVGLAFWEVLGRLEWVSPLFFPAPSVIITTLYELLMGGELGRHVGATVTRVFYGFLFGAFVGLVLGMVMGWSSKIRLIIDPFVAAAHPVPKISTLPLIMLVFGIGMFSKTLVIAIGAFFPMLINTMAGVRQISPIYFEVAENYGATRLGVFTRVVMPGSFPMVLAGARLALNRSLSITIAVELLMGESGLGSMIWYSWETLRVEELYATIIVVATLGVSFRWGLQLLSNRLVPWQVERTV